MKYSTILDPSSWTQKSTTFSQPRSILGIAIKILKETEYLDQYAYEREGCWYLGIGSKISLTIDSNGSSATTNFGDNVEKDFTKSITTEDLADVARQFLNDHSDPTKRVFGQVGFNFAAHCRKIKYTPVSWPLLMLMVPRVQIAIRSDGIDIGYEAQDSFIGKKIEQHVDEFFEMQMREDTTTDNLMSSHEKIDTSIHGEDYMNNVTQAKVDIKSGLYQKVILSRAVPITQEIDMIQTLHNGRLQNTPKRSFFVNHCGIQATGFSPELVMLLKDGKVATEPLAGTRAAGQTAEEHHRLKNELQRDPKEIVEHVISVKEAVFEAEQVSVPGTVAVEDFMTVRPRGNVQHLGSRVAGTLTDECDGWDAFKVFFPSITASGIPKQDALVAIERMEKRPRELYSGAILMLEKDTEFFEAALVLRTVFKDGKSQWIQAGAGIVEQSRPERELTETREKMSTVAPYIVYK